MGCTHSDQVQIVLTFVVNDVVEGQGPLAQKDFNLLGLTEVQVDYLFNVFQRISRSRSGMISLAEFYDYFPVERSPFSERVFSTMDINKNGGVDFHEFVLMMWLYCSLDRRDLTDFAFTMYDNDGDGYLTIHDFRELLLEVYGIMLASNPVVQYVLKEVEGQSRTLISKNEFKMINHNNSGLLFPAFRMQACIAERVFGNKKLWLKEEKKRETEGLGSQATVWQTLSVMGKFSVPGAPAALEETTLAMPGRANLKPRGRAGSVSAGA